MIVAVEGIDGSGKSLLARLLAERLSARGHEVTLIEKHSLALPADFAGRRMAELRGILWPGEPEPSADALGTEFYLFLLAAWFAGLDRMIGASRERQILIADGSHYRVIAKAHLRGGLDIGWLEGLFARAPQPDVVLLLDIDPALAWRRRPAFKATEIGRWDGQASPPDVAFCSYQGRVRELLLTFARRHGWLVIGQDAATGPEATVADAEALLGAHLRQVEALTPSRSD